jgi:F-type H+-transporting ATPase subunit b
MAELVHQLGELFLRAVPVVLVILIFYFILRSIFFKPLLAVMNEREARTQGAQKEAEQAQHAAAEKVRQYEDALKHAKAKVYAEQEAERKKVLDERAAFLKETRGKATAEVNQAKERVDAEFEAAKKDIEKSAVQLAAEIARRLLPVTPGSGSPAREAR